MPTKQKTSKFLNNLKDYRKKFLVKKYENLDESATRIMINSFLSDVLGYTPIDEIKTEYAIKGTFADYVIQLQKSKKFIVEVKSIQIDLNEQHLRQALNYSANEGIDWVLLTNGRQFELYRVLFNKPVTYKKIFSHNLLDAKELSRSAGDIELITKKSIIAKNIDKFWARFQNLESNSLSKLFYSEEIIKAIRRKLKSKTGISFSDTDLIDAIYKVIILPIPSTKPKSLQPITRKEKKIIEIHEKI